MKKRQKALLALVGFFALGILGVIWSALPQLAVSQAQTGSVAEVDIIAPIIAVGLRAAPLVRERIRSKDARRRDYLIESLFFLRDRASAPDLIKIALDSAESVSTRSTALSVLRGLGCEPQAFADQLPSDVRLRAYSLHPSEAPSKTTGWLIIAGMY